MRRVRVDCDDACRAPRQCFVYEYSDVRPAIEDNVSGLDGLICIAISEPIVLSEVISEQIETWITAALADPIIPCGVGNQLDVERLIVTFYFELVRVKLDTV